MSTKSRSSFAKDADESLLDINGIPIDGDGDGAAGGAFRYWFPVKSPTDTIFVDKAGLAFPDGSLAAPFQEISTALAVAQPGQLVRIVGNGGIDRDPTTTSDNQAYEIGFTDVGAQLADGPTFHIPQEVTVVIDAGAILKLRRAAIVAGSTSSVVPQNAGSLQILGTPGLPVILTSLHDQRHGVVANPEAPQPEPGDWGGLLFSSEVDRQEARFDWESEGFFLDYVNQAEIDYGGGSVVLNTIAEVIAPIELRGRRPTVSYNQITNSASAAVAGTPDSFTETSFRAARFQATPFTPEAHRVGPDIHDNRVSDNQRNALLIRIDTATGAVRELTTSARFDDRNLAHVLEDSLIIAGQPGGPILAETALDSGPVSLNLLVGSGLGAGQYNYRITQVDADFVESLASAPTATISVELGQQIIRLNGLPAAQPPFISRRLYRSANDGNGPYQLVAELGSTETTFIDSGGTLGGTLVDAAGTLARPHGSLIVDPGVVVKSDMAGIRITGGGQLVAEGLPQRPVVFTSIFDDRFGGGGTFDSGGDGPSTGTPGDWGGIYAGLGGKVSLDNAVIAYGGGVTPLQGAFAAFNPLEIHQAEARLTGSLLEHNLDGTGGTAPANRFGLGENRAGSIFAIGTQPVVLRNTLRDNNGPAVSIDVNSLNHDFVDDPGRTTGPWDPIPSFPANQGPLVRDNFFLGNDINGMLVRGGTLTTQGVWDDTSTVHALNDHVYVPDFHTFGGLRLQSSAGESLVVKLAGINAGFTATGRPLDVPDRIGGRIQILGRPQHPVVLTSLADDMIGAGELPNGLPNTDTNNDGAASSPGPGDWQGVLFDQYSHDRNVAVVFEREGLNTGESNGTPNISEFVGSLSDAPAGGDESVRLGFEVHGQLSGPADVDVFSFRGIAGTEVWLDLDLTTANLDSIVEFIDFDGNVVARSDNSTAERAGTEAIVGDALPLAGSRFSGSDFYTLNPRDAGLRVQLFGVPGNSQTYHVRIRSSSSDLSDLQGGLTDGPYQFQIRLREQDELPGSTIKLADVRYSTDGITLKGMPGHSPLLGEATESSLNNDTLATAQPLGNLLTSDRAAISVAGQLTGVSDQDWFQFEVQYQQVATLNNVVNAFFDVDWADGLLDRPDTVLSIFDVNGRLIFTGDDSNIADDFGSSQLRAGSAGLADPFVGNVLLPEGTYYVALHAVDAMPDELRQFTEAEPPNKLVRLEPINSVNRILEDHIDAVGPSTANPPQLINLFDADSVIAPHLGDVPLIVSHGLGQTALSITNALTGAVDPVPSPLIGVEISDLTRRSDDVLIGLTLGSTDASSGNLRSIDPNSGSHALIGDDSIITYQPNFTPPPDILHSDEGIQFHATVSGQISFSLETLFAVGRRDSTPPGVSITENILYTINPFTGTAGNLGPPRTTGAATSAVERGELRTDAFGGPGGRVTGLAILNNLLYAVSDTGGLYTVANPFGPATAFYQSTATDLTGIQFAGLTAGPAGIEDGIYEDLLFGIDTNGVVYAFNTAGVLQPIFVDGATSVSTGISNATGLAFGPMPSGWHITSDRQSEPGHGLNAAPNGTRSTSIDGGLSFHFGRSGENRYDDAGGAEGSLVSKPFDLPGVAADKPTLYFNYFLNTEDVNGSQARDTLRVSITDGTSWQLLATNNDHQPELALGLDDVEPLFDNSNSWRQARVDLSPFAGLDNLQLRFDFSTAGQLLDVDSTGVELWARPGNELADGEGFAISGVQFEFDRGFSLLMTEGAEIADSSTVLINGSVFEFDTGNGAGGSSFPVPYAISDTPRSDRPVVGRRYQRGRCRTRCVRQRPPSEPDQRPFRRGQRALHDRRRTRRGSGARSHQRRLHSRASRVRDGRRHQWPLRR